MGQSTPYPFQLLDVRLYEAVIERLEPDESVEAEDIAQIPIAVNLEVVEHSDRRLSAFLTLDTKGLENEFRLRFTLQGVFETSVDLKDVEQELRQEFEDHSAVFLLWPYARECMHNFAHQIRKDLPLLPTLNRLAMVH